MARGLRYFAIALALAVPALLASGISPAYAVNSAPSFTADSPPASAAVGTAFSYSFIASGSPSPTFAVSSGAVPAGLTLDSTTGALSGTPTVAGPYTFTVTATNGVGSPAVSGSITIDVEGGPAFTAEAPPATAATGISYAYSFLASGYPAPTFGVQSGTLPPGLALSPASGLLFGLPTTVGVYTFSISATNVVTTAVTPNLSITVSAPSAPVFTADVPPSASFDVAYSYAFGARGSPTPTFFVASGVLPTGLSLSPDTGILSGTATVVGTYTFAIGATNGVGTSISTPIFSFVVGYPSPPTFTADTPSTPADVGSSYSYTFTATATPVASFFVDGGSLPPGLTLDSTTGVLSGVPTSAGSYSFSIEAYNANGVVLSPTVTITTQLLVAPALTRDTPPARGIVGTRYSGYLFAATGSPVPTFSIAGGTLPPGLVLNAETGLLSGTPTTAGSFTFQVGASNGVGNPVSSPSVTMAVVHRPVLSVDAHNVKVVGEIALVPVRCSAAACRGTIRLRHQGVVAGTATYTFAAGRSMTVRIRLNPTGYKLLARSRRRHLAATATVVDVGASTYLKALLIVG